MSDFTRQRTIHGRRIHVSYLSRHRRQPPRRMKVHRSQRPRRAQEHLHRLRYIYRRSICIQLPGRAILFILPRVQLVPGGDAQNITLVVKRQTRYG